MPWEQVALAEPLLEDVDLYYSNPAYLLAVQAAAFTEPICADSSSSEAQRQEAGSGRNSIEPLGLHSFHSSGKHDVDQMAETSKPSCCCASEEGLCSAGSLSSCHAKTAVSCSREEASREQRPSRAALLAVKAVLLLFFCSILLLFGSFHWYVHQASVTPGRAGAHRREGPPAAAGRTAASYSGAAAGDVNGAYSGSSDDGDLLSWERLAAQHGSAAVIVLGDGGSWRPVTAASDAPAVLPSMEARPQYSALADAAAEDEAVPPLLSHAAFHLGRAGGSDTVQEASQEVGGSSSIQTRALPRLALEVTNDTAHALVEASPSSTQRVMGSLMRRGDF